MLLGEETRICKSIYMYIKVQKWKVENDWHNSAQSGIKLINIHFILRWFRDMVLISISKFYVWVKIIYRYFVPCKYFGHRIQRQTHIWHKAY